MLAHLHRTSLAASTRFSFTPACNLVFHQTPEQEYEQNESRKPVSNTLQSYRRSPLCQQQGLGVLGQGPSWLRQAARSPEDTVDVALHPPRARFGESICGANCREPSGGLGGRGRPFTPSLLTNLTGPEFRGALSYKWQMYI